MMFPRTSADVKIDPKWVEGLRKWVKKTFRPKTSYSNPQEVREHLRHLMKVELEKLYEYLLYAQGLKIRDDAGDIKSIIDKLRDKVAEELKAAHQAMDDKLSRINWLIEANTPGTWEYDQRPDLHEFYDEKPPGKLLEHIQSDEQEALSKVDDILSGRLLRFVSQWLTRYAGGLPFETEPLWLEYNVGKVKVVFDTGRDESGKSRSLITFKDYAPELIKAKALLERKGFGDLWYGPMFVSCLACGGKNPLGEKFGVGASYVIGRDHINVYDDPHENLAGLIIHELGHRYYYRRMSPGDRARFDSYFKEVPATSEYGGTISSEDFPEVFKAFVLGRDLTRDQIERFKAFLADKDRGRFAATADVVIDPEWVADFQDRVKRTFVPKATYQTLEDIQGHLNHLLDVDLENLYKYVFFSQGLYPRDIKKKKRLPTDLLRERITKDLNDARDRLEYTLKKLTDIIAAIHNHEEIKVLLANGEVKVFSGTEEGIEDYFLNLYQARIKESLEQVVIWLGDNIPKYILSWLKKNTPGKSLELEGLPTEYSIDKVKVIFSGQDPWEKHPRPFFTFKDYAPSLIRAKALLEKKGFGRLWYGPMFVSCLKCGGKNPHGKQFGVGGQYNSSRDSITIFSDPGPGITRLALHELGHRYYYKFMTQGDRARFDSYFKKVLAPSKYGGTASAEDFAEVFQLFLFEYGLTRDQVDRFKAFLAGEDRSRMASTIVDRFLATATRGLLPSA